jgi:hypothetical protein
VLHYVFTTVFVRGWPITFARFHFSSTAQSMVPLKLLIATSRLQCTTIISVVH